MPDRPAIEVLIGLRNPGARYDPTRHNAGQWFVDLLLAQYLLKLSAHKSWPLEAAQIKGLNILLSTTYMNLSGQGIGQFCRYYKIPSAAILVAHDDVDLPVGAIKLKFGGGDGGHNGLKSLTDHMSNGLRVTNIRQKLITQAFTLRSALNKTSNINKIH